MIKALITFEYGDKKIQTFIEFPQEGINLKEFVRESLMLANTSFQIAIDEGKF